MTSPHKALIANASRSADLTTRPLPALRADYLLIKTVSVALNPTDWKHVRDGLAPGTTVGCDYAGIVEAVGPKVVKRFAKGDHVFGFAQGCNVMQKEDGAFAEYMVAKGDVQWRKPENVSFEEAATLGIGIATVVQSLYQGLGLEWPKAGGEEEEVQGSKGVILIYGGSTATGYLAVQCAKLSGYTVIATSSPHNFEYVRAAGADYVLDYKDPGAVGEVRKITDGKLKLVLDTISLEQSVKFCEAALSEEGGKYHSILSITPGRKDVQYSFSLAYTIIAEDMHRFGGEWPARPADKAYMESFGPLFESLLAQGKIKPIKPRVGERGLNGILDGLKQMEEKKVSGEKLVYNIADTA
ncbi:zinc-binding oxidoreductase ToxD [Penicillium chermesinum]|uniref:Zinc-binding oxidoreductase ToxD n=1 Tax=Penicillium chermesinum TaxID=63820 RepID=A0A9W9PJX4_9EURO|nr:zinc-binding oxidoreductase ToxD [Penicillium chermesinum]KAJ5248790.1 zinc-binding oxidoreductase ToxD [Penicillium chermesinum]